MNLRSAPGKSVHRMRRRSGTILVVTVVVTLVVMMVVVVVVPQCIARPGRTYTPRQHLRMWQLRAPCRRRTDGRTGPQPRNAPHVTHMLPAGLSFHVDDDPPAGDVSLQPARPLPRINVRVRARKSGSCGNRAAPLLCGGIVLRGRRSWKPLLAG